MTVADRILERVKAMSPQAQEQLLRCAEHLSEHPEDDLRAWLASSAKLGMAGWPKEDWSREFAATQGNAGGADASRCIRAVFELP